MITPAWIASHQSSLPNAAPRFPPERRSYSRVHTTPGSNVELRRLLEWAAASWRSLRVAVDPLGERAGGASSLFDPARRSLAALALATRLDPKVQGRLSPEVEAPLLRRFEEQVCAAAPE